MSEYDVFISYASEDKEEIVQPIARALDGFGLRVWLDEKVLDVGDSLSEAIDKGLSKSRYGVVVLSPSFLKKRRGWPGYELRGLNAREIGSEKIVLPVWHAISREEVLEHSPALADKFALDTSRFSTGEIALRILKVVRPEIFQHLHRWSLYKESYSKASPELVELSALKLGPIRHKKLPDSLLLRARLIYEALSDASPLSLDEMITSFRRDLHPAEEVETWERIAASYLIYTKGKGLSLEERRGIVGTLISLSMQGSESLERLLKETPNDGEFWELAQVYVTAIPAISDVEEVSTPNPVGRADA